jgi:lipoprotein-anchoring transpeptidase ErfK/SrfK
VNRGLSIAVVALGFVVAGILPAFAFAALPPLELGARSAPRAPYVPAGVRIAGVRVGGLDAAAAARAVASAFARPLPVVIDGRTFELHPTNVAKAYVAGAVARAHAATAGDNVVLTVAVDGAAVRAFVDRVGRAVDHRSVPARLQLLNGQPLITGNVAGHTLGYDRVIAGIVHELTTSTRLPLRFKTVTVRPSTTRSDIGSVILINRSLNRLTFFGDGTMRRFPVATGQSIYPTPTGRFQIVVKWKDPWWYPPTYDSWARGLKPVPPGPGNPLGTRWMGLSAPGVGIHGTDDPGSIGYSVSHGCIRMQVPDAEWLFDHVAVGTTVFIV